MYMKWVNLQFTHLCRDAGHVAIDALWEPEKSVNPGLRAKKTEFPALRLVANSRIGEEGSRQNKQNRKD